ncbi:MAG: flagellar brake protein [Thermodesulfovibrionales bacterium]|nr:flagellar brake protein [Thermodesulfovibrionales bacterium]
MNHKIFNIGLILSIEMPKNRNYVMTPLIGLEKDLYLIVKLVYVDGKPLNIKNKENYTVRFFKDGSAYGFRTEVLSILFYPAPLIFLKYPEKIETLNIRKEERYKTNIPAKLMDSQEIIRADAAIMDISKTGCLLKAPITEGIEFNENNFYYLAFRVMDKNLEVDCLLRNLKKGKSNQFLGMEFSNLSMDNKAAINAFVDILKGLIV